MLTFQYKAANAEGSIVNGTLNANNRGEVVEQLYALGRVPIRIHETATQQKK